MKKINNINATEAIKKAEKLIKNEKGLSPAVKSAMQVLILLVTILVNRFNLNSSNSSKPPSGDTDRKRGSKNKKSNRKQGGQKGHAGTNLEKVKDPDEIEFIEIDKRTLPKGKYKEVGYESRQVIDIEISRVVTEYRAQILEDKNGKQYVAGFPEGITKAVQYGGRVKSNSVYISQYQAMGSSPDNRQRCRLSE